MGLRDLSTKDLKKAQKVLEALDFYGVKETDIPYIAKIKSLEEEIILLKKTLNKIASNNQNANFNDDTTSIVQEFKPYER